MWDTSSNDCFSIVMLVFHGVSLYNSGWWMNYSSPRLSCANAWNISNCPGPFANRILLVPCVTDHLLCCGSNKNRAERPNMSFSCRYATWISGIVICLSWPLHISPYVRDGHRHWLYAYLLNPKRTDRVDVVSCLNDVFRIFVQIWRTKCW